jgi:hypothetical protein
MNKQEVSKRVLKGGKPLSLDLFSWDEKTNTFSGNEYGLIIDFNGISDCTFNTGCGCTFNTGNDCTFKTGSNCTFNTGYGCTFKVGKECVLVRRDVYETFIIPEGKEIKLNDYGIKGYTEVQDQIELTIKVNGKEVSLKDISEETLLNIRNNS